MASSYFTFTKQAGTGVQTVPGVVLRTGKAALLFSSRMTANGVADGAHLCQGVCDANGQACRVIGHPGNEVATTSSQAEFRDRIIVFTNQTSGATPTIQVEGQFVQFTSNGGLMINWLVNDGQPLIIHVVMFDVPNATLSFTEFVNGIDNIVTGLGYRPKVLVVTTGALEEDTPGTIATNYNVGAPFGCFHGIGFSDGSQQLCALTKARGIGGAAECKFAAMPFTSCMEEIIANLLASTPLSAGATSLDADGYTVFHNAETGKTPLSYYLSLGGAALSCTIGDVQIPTSPGNVTVSLGYQADVVFFVGVGSIAVSQSIFLGALARDGSQGGVWVGGTDGSSPSAFSRANFNGACVRSYTPALSGASTIKNEGVGSISPTGFTVNYGTVMSTSGSPIRNVYYLAVSVPVVPIPAAPSTVLTPKAAQEPCDPQPETTSGGKGASGCNPGGVGHEITFTGPVYGNIPVHDDPSEGESFAGRDGEGFEPYVIIQHVDYPTDVVTAYPRAMVELGDVPTYDGGRKPAALIGLGTVQNSIGNELGTPEAASVDVQLTDANDNFVRNMLDDQDMEGDEVDVKMASDLARRTAVAPKVLSRAIIHSVQLQSVKKASLSAEDESFAPTGPLGPNQKFPNWTFGDLGLAAPNLTNDLKSVALPIGYGEKSDWNARDPLTNAISMKGKVSGRFIGRFGSSTFPELGTLAAPPDVTGKTLDVLVGQMNQLIADGVPAVNWQDTLGFDFGTSDLQRLINGELGIPIPVSFTPLAAIVGEGDLLAGLGVGTTPSPGGTDDWGVLVFHGTPIYRYISVHGSNLGGGDPKARHDRITLDINARAGADLLVPGYDNWPFTTTYLPFTNPETGRTFWLSCILVRGPLLDDHISGAVNITANMILTEDVGDGSGLPIIEIHKAEHHWYENHLLNRWSSGLYTTTVDFPKYADGTPKIRSSSFVVAQNQTANDLGGLGLTISWIAEAQIPNIQMIDNWNKWTASYTPRTALGQFRKFRFSPTEDPTGTMGGGTPWPRIDHIPDIFGPVVQNSGVERENVVIGSGDYDNDKDKFMIGAIRRTSAAGIKKNKNLEKKGDPILNEMLDDAVQLTWTLDRRLTYQQFGMRFIEIQGKRDWLDYDVCTGVLLTSPEGYSSVGYINHPFIIWRRRYDFGSKKVTLTLWDVKDVLYATMGVPEGDLSGGVTPEQQDPIMGDDISGITDDSTFAPYVLT